MSLAENLSIVRARIAAACLAVGRHPGEVQLLAVSKKVTIPTLHQAFGCGQHAFGENYLQEALPKITALADRHPVWHFIGPIQSNKTAEIAAHFDWVHGVDRLKIAERLSLQRPATQPALKVCVQVNVSGEASKSGCRPEEAVLLAERVAQLPRLALRGFMCLPAPAHTRQDPRAPFQLLRQLQAQAQARGLQCDTLSMGMSDDLEQAIAEGATLIRVGTAIFGRRIAGMPADETAS